MPVPHDRRTFLKQAAVLAAGGLLAACSAPSTDNPTSSTSGQTTAPAAGSSIKKLSYALASVNGLHFVATVASEKPELFAPYGLQIDLVTTTNSPNAVNALIGGSVDVAAVTPDSAWPAQDKAPDMKQVMAISDGTPYVVLAQPEISTAADLRGKTIGASAIKGGADILALRVMLAEAGVRDSDYTVVQAGAISDRTAAMKARAIDAVAQLEPQATTLRDEGFRELDNANSYPSLKGVHSVVLLAKQDWYASNDSAVSLIKGWDAVTKWIYDPANKAELLAITKKTMGANDRSAEAVYTLHVTAQSVSPNLHISEKYMQQFLENQKTAGGENLPSDAMKYVDSALVDRAFKS
jgi:ABC-type nitrate/sulfonate/bicarbonate transport system substrate-binding protein